MERMSTAFLPFVLMVALAGSTPDRDAGPARGKPTPKAAGPCRKPSDKTLVKVALKPDTEVADVIAWHAATTCSGVLMSNSVPLAGKKVSILAPQPITMAELRRLFHAALDSVGLAAEP
jgi:hypothetical protein